MEVLVALGIASVVILAVVTLNINAISTFFFFREKSKSNEESRNILYNIAKQVQMAGGGPVGISVGIWVEDGNNGNNGCKARPPFSECDGADRLTLLRYGSFSFVDVSVDASQNNSCMITNQISSTVLQIYKDASNKCCLNASFAHQQALLVLNGSYGNKYISNVDLGACNVTIADGLAYEHDTLPRPADWKSASLNIVNVTTYYLDKKTNHLMQYVDPGNKKVLDDTTTQVLADQIYDFQVALGYDTNPGDGMVSDLGNDMDEWLYNAPTKPESLSTGFLKDTSPGGLSMVQIGLILGFKDANIKNSPSSLQILNGPKIDFPTGVSLSSSVNKVMPRNLQVFK